ncbi:MAG TPA: tetratricopeptide repeat protein, partial [Chthoniobacterales bacterium]|nr:tetratricopeptide repeat protein [Chthoniobacterales bacterium]
VFPAWELPNWSLRLTVVLLLIGFPLALILAWAFDVTPQGIRTTPTLPPNQDPAVGHRHRRRNIALLIGSGVLVSAIAGFFLLPRADATKMDKSIAVLPFENFSDKSENAFFADGIQDDILTNLSKIGDLKVISRTSVMSYRGKPKSVRQIGKELGVSAILEGSVRREGNRVRVNVQLINTANDEHIWAEDYDRDLTDVFAIQTDLAQKIAHELRAQLSPSEQQQMTRRPTENGEAYLAFVEAHNLNASLEDREKLKQAQQLYERAIQLDPRFVLAIANLSILHSWTYHTYEPTEAERDWARKYADQALQVAPNSPEAHLAHGYSLYYGAQDFEGALREFAIAQEGLPNNAQVYLVIGAIQRRQGRWKESTANLEKAVELNPKDAWPLQNLYFNYQMQRQFDAAARVLDRALALNPLSPTLHSIRTQLAIAAHGDLNVFREELAEFEQAKAAGRFKDDPEVLVYALVGKANLLMLERKYQEVIETVRHYPAEETKEKPHGVIEAALLEGAALEKLGKAAEARAAFERAKTRAEVALKEAPDEPSRHKLLANALAHLGEKEAAIAEAKRAVALRPESRDAFEGPGYTIGLAEVYALTGENAKAIELLDGLLLRPSDLTVHVLKLDPAFDTLRSDPGFQNLLAKYEKQG